MHGYVHQVELCPLPRPATPGVAGERPQGVVLTVPSRCGLPGHHRAACMRDRVSL